MTARRWAYGLTRKAVTFVAAFVVWGLTLCVSAQRDAYAQGAGEAGTSASAPVQAMPPSAPAAGAGQVPIRQSIIGINNRQQTIPYKLTSETLEFDEVDPKSALTTGLVTTWTLKVRLRRPSDFRSWTCRAARPAINELVRRMTCSSYFFLGQREKQFHRIDCTAAFHVHGEA